MHRKPLPLASGLLPGLLLGAALATPATAIQAALPVSPVTASAWQDTKAEPGYLGISYALAEGGGVQVTEVIPGTPAERAGLKGGDVIVSAGDRRVASDQALLDVLAQRGVGGKVMLGVQRGEETLTVKVVLASRANPGGEEPETEPEEPAQSEDAKAEAGSREEANVREALRALGYVGSTTEDAPQDSAQEAEHEPGFLGVFPSTVEGGVRIDQVIAGGAAQRAGLQAGDRIVSLDGKALRDDEALRAAISERAAGTEIKLVVRRGERELEKTLRLDGRDGDMPVPVEIEVREVPAEPEAGGGAGAAPEAARRAEELRRQIEAELRQLEGGSARSGGGVVQRDERPQSDRPDRPRADDGRSSEAEALRDALRQLQDSEQSAPAAGGGFLGVQLDGLTVTSTVDESGARRAGVRAGETIVSLDGREIGTLADLQRLLAQRPAGTRAVLGLRSEQGLRELEVVLGSRPAAVDAGGEEPPADAQPDPRPDPELSDSVREGLSNLPDASRGYLGVALAEEDGQVSVTQVLEGTPAAAVGLRAGDVITRIAGFDVHTLNDLRNALGEFAPGQEFPLVVLREGEPQRFAVALAPRPDAAAGEPDQADQPERRVQQGQREGEARRDAVEREVRDSRPQSERLQAEAEAIRRELEALQQRARREAQRGEEARRAEGDAREAEARAREQAQRPERQRAEQGEREARDRQQQTERDVPLRRDEEARARVEEAMRRFEERRQREMRLMDEQVTQRMQQLRRDLQEREQVLQRELENMRRRLEGVGGGDRAEAMRQRLERWRAGNERLLEEQLESMRARVRALRSGEGDGATADAPRPQRAVRDDLGATLRALREEVGALRAEVRRLRAEVGQRGGSGR